MAFKDDDFVYYLFAKEFGWTPEQVENLTIYQINRFLYYIDIGRRAASGRTGGRQSFEELDAEDVAFIEQSKRELGLT